MIQQSGTLLFARPTQACASFEVERWPLSGVVTERFDHIFADCSCECVIMHDDVWCRCVDMHIVE